MKTKIKYYLFFLFLVFTSCENREWDNPFDPDCPKELFTPANFIAKQEGNVVKLTWEQSNNQISGFVIERSVDSGDWVTLANPSKTEITWSDTNIEGGKVYLYRITAKAGNNLSDNITSKTLIAPTLFNSNLTYETVIDVDGNFYKTIVIGTQKWLAENLRTTKFNDGTLIPLVTEFSNWNNITTPAYCWVNNDAATYKSTYGAIYNWPAVNSNKLCPIGWHVPSWNEWVILRDYLGGISVAGGKLKEIGLTHWASPNAGATNSTGFSALPGGFMDGSDFRYSAWFYSSQEGISIRLPHDHPDLWIYQAAASSVRCIKD